MKRLRSTILAVSLGLGAFRVVRADVPGDFPELVALFVMYLSRITGILMAVALLVFIAGVARYILNKDNKSVIEESKRVIGHGIIALFVLASLWGILAFLGEAIDFPLTEQQ